MASARTSWAQISWTHRATTTLANAFPNPSPLKVNPITTTVTCQNDGTRLGRQEIRSLHTSEIRNILNNLHSIVLLPSHIHKCIRFHSFLQAKREKELAIKMARHNERLVNNESKISCIEQWNQTQKGKYIMRKTRMIATRMQTPIRRRAIHSLMAFIAVAMQASGAGIHDNAVMFDTDSAPVGVDNRCTG
jgi:hypothetical protein